MQKNIPLVLRILSSSVSISKKAGSIIRDKMRSGNLNIIDKGFNDLQTEADRSSQMCIVKSLEKQFPKVCVIGEEDLGSDYQVSSDWIITKNEESVLAHKCPSEFENVQDEDVIVWVDPLDGTSEFAQGLLDHVTILIGLSINGKAIGGVIHQPYFNYDNGNNHANAGRTIWGLSGLGTFGIEKNHPPKEKFIITTTRSHGSETINKSIEEFSPDEVIRVGGAGQKVLLVIEGKAHAYVFASRGCKKWDTCAPEAILESLGGRLTDMFGQQLTYNRNENFTNELGVLASYASETHQLYCQKVSQGVKERLLKNSKSFFKCFG